MGQNSFKKSAYWKQNCVQPQICDKAQLHASDKEKALCASWNTFCFQHTCSCSSFQQTLMVQVSLYDPNWSRGDKNLLKILCWWYRCAYSCPMCPHLRLNIPNYSLCNHICDMKHRMLNNVTIVESVPRIDGTSADVVEGIPRFNLIIWGHPAYFWVNQNFWIISWIQTRLYMPNIHVPPSSNFRHLSGWFGEGGMHTSRGMWGSWLELQVDREQ